MKTIRRKFIGKVKVQVAIEAVKERESMTDIAKRLEVFIRYRLQPVNTSFEAR